MDNQISDGSVYDATRSPRRRAVIIALSEHGDFMTVSDLSELLASMLEGDSDGYTQPERKRVYVSLKQTHLPFLDQHGYIDRGGVSDYAQGAGWAVATGKCHRVADAMHNMELQARGGRETVRHTGLPVLTWGARLIPLAEQYEQSVGGEMPPGHMMYPPP